jgi:hypothetical protein
MPPMIWAAPMARVRLGRFESSCIQFFQNLGPWFQALASFSGWTMAMTPSPMRTMAAKCLARVGLVINMSSERVRRVVPLPVGSGKLRWW